MKTLAAILLFVLFGIGAASAQQSGGTKLMAETTVKGAPFSADAINESVQVLADGNRIVRSSTNKLYRNSEGRFRREMSGGSGGSFGSFYSVGPGITILDPVGGHRYLLDSYLMTARVGPLRGFGGMLAPLPPKVPAPAPAPVVPEKMKSELKAAMSAADLAAKGRAYGELAELKTAAAAAELAAKGKVYAEVAKAYGDALSTGLNGSFVYSPGKGSRWETKTEELGVQNIEGVEATGTRATTTIPPGEIGNERPIEIVYEKWYSKELQLVVMSRHYDPRFGEQTYRLTNIVRSEPDPSLFEVPTGYKMLSEAAPAYKISMPLGQNVVYAKSPGATTVKQTKP